MGAVLIWSTLAAVVKSVVTSIPNLEALSVSSAVAFLTLFLFNLRSGQLKTLRNYSARQYLKMVGLGLIGMFLYSAFYYLGLSQLSSQEACILNYLWPIMLVLFSILLLHERLTVLKLLAMICSFAGVVVLSAGGGKAGGNHVLGVISCVAAAAMYGLFCVLNKKAEFDELISMMVIWLTVAGTSAVTGLTLETWVPIVGKQWLGILWNGVMINAVAYLCWALALKSADNTAAIANLAYLTPFLSLFVSAVLLHEAITLRAILALVFILGGILIQNLRIHGVHQRKI
jgi:drug/metabolite transporter (DMT)-like permease